MKEFLMRLTPLDIFVLGAGLLCAVIVVVAGRSALKRLENSKEA